MEQPHFPFLIHPPNAVTGQFMHTSVDVYLTSGGCHQCKGPVDRPRHRAKKSLQSNRPIGTKDGYSFSTVRDLKKAKYSLIDLFFRKKVSFGHAECYQLKVRTI